MYDSLWSKVVKAMAGHRCEKCGNPNTLNSHHVFGRVARSTRWVVENGVCLCAKCHKFSSIFSAHETPALFHIFILDKRGEQWFNKLRERHNNLDKNAVIETIEELKHIAENLGVK